MKTAFKPRFRSQYRETAAREKHREKQNGSGAVQYRETNIIAFGLTTRNVSVSFVFFFFFFGPHLSPLANAFEDESTVPRYLNRLLTLESTRSLSDLGNPIIIPASPAIMINLSFRLRARAHACKFVHLTTTDFFIKSGATDRRDFSVFRFDSTGHGKHTVAGFPNRCLPYLPHRRAFATSRFFFPFFFFTPRQALDARFAA